MVSHELSEEERLAWLRLIRSENVGPVTFRQLLRRYGGAGEALKALPHLARRGGRTAGIRICPPEAAQRERDGLVAIGGRFVAQGESGYPTVLASLEDAPPLLAVRGDGRHFDAPAVAVVGARNASANGRRLAATLARALAAEGLTVVSGLARGIDAAAHRGALDAGGASTTIAVIAGGLDTTYPPEHRALQEEIAERGLVLSEAPLGIEPQARHFPRRNRLVSGLSLGVVVVEGAPRSGSLITARLALEQGREVMAVPGSPLDPRAQGPNGLIRQGATLIQTAEDVLECLQPLVAAPAASAPQPLFRETAPDPVAAPDDARRQVLELLGPTPVAVDELLRGCHFAASLVQAALLELELAGRLDRQPGNRVALIA